MREMKAGLSRAVDYPPSLAGALRERHWGKLGGLPDRECWAYAARYAQFLG